ncbi:MAG: hypothetical protein AAF004_04645 [Pseudomonadota bacterium]
MRWHTYIIAASALALVVSFWNRNTFVDPAALLPAIDAEPEQRKTLRRAFDARWQGDAYQITPEFDYELTGLVVSFRQHDGNSRMHQRSADHLNVADLCVVWAGTARNPHLNKVSFWNGVFTCNFKTTDRAAWEAFDIHQISNNHLLSDDPTIRNAIDDVRIGDQITLRGSLASYVSPNGSKRGTSVTRQDTGNGACETIYVDSFEILQRSTSGWRMLMYVSLCVFLISLFGYVMTPHKVRQ